MHFFHRENITLGIAILGAVLGILNTFNSFRQQRLRLVVSAKHAFTVGRNTTDRPMVCIEVRNLSTFPVFIAEIGFRIAGRTERLAITQPITTDGKAFARRLEARQAVTGYAYRDTFRTIPDRCYATTDTGDTVLGNKLDV